MTIDCTIMSACLYQGICATVPQDFKLLATGDIRRLSVLVCQSIGDKSPSPANPTLSVMSWTNMSIGKGIW